MSDVGKKGGQRVKKLVEEGKEHEKDGKMTVAEAGSKGGERSKRLIQEGKSHEKE